MQYLLFILFLGNMQLLATSVHWDGTDSGKNKYTHSLHLQYRKDIETLAKSTFKQPVHPFYQMLFWAQQSAVSNKLENWLVHHLLNTAGHWGWAKNKTAGKCETNIYYEVGLCQFLTQPQASVVAQAPQFLGQIRKDSRQILEDADGFAIKGNNYFIFRVLWRAKHGWESAIDSRGCLMAYYMMSVGISGSALYGEPINPDVVPYRDAGAYQMLDQASFDRACNEATNSAQYTAQLLSQRKQSIEQLFSDEKALNALIEEVSQRPSLPPVPVVNRRKLQEWGFQLEDGTEVYRDAQWVYLGNENYRGKSLTVEGRAINDMPLRAPLELKHSSTPEEMFAAIRRAGLKIKGVLPASLAYLLRS